MPAPRPPRAVVTVEEFYAHALAMELEAAERYEEFAEYFAGRGEDALAGMCGKLSAAEREHFHELTGACANLELPAIAAADYRWLEGGAPETAARELLYRVATPRGLLEIALGAELRARAYFVWIARTAASLEVRQLASIMAAEEVEHVQWVRQALEDHGAEAPDWETLLGEGIGPGTAQP